MTSDELRLTPGARVLLAGCDTETARALQDCLERAGHFVLVAADGEETLRLVRRGDPEAVLMTVGLPRLNAFQICERLKSHPTTRSIGIVLLVRPDQRDELVRGLDVGADDFLTLPADPLALLARLRLLVRGKRLADQMSMTEDVIFSLARMLEAKMSESATSQQRLSTYAYLLGEALGLDPEEMRVLRKGAVLHDIGKIAVRETVLQKRGRLDEDEMSEMRLHPVIGERLCSPLPDADALLPIIRHHQERWDGRGYPDGLRGEQIPLLARIIAIADAYDAMLSPRPYRAALPPEKAREALRQGAGAQWDPRLVETFLAALDRRDRLAA